jgi:hypothetical protein
MLTAPEVPELPELVSITTSRFTAMAAAEKAPPEVVTFAFKVDVVTELKLITPVAVMAWALNVEAVAVRLVKPLAVPIVMASPEALKTRALLPPVIAPVKIFLPLPPAVMVRVAELPVSVSALVVMFPLVVVKFAPKFTVPEPFNIKLDADVILFARVAVLEFVRVKDPAEIISPLFVNSV